jgi:CRP-like cAMP-binding protein
MGNAAELVKKLSQLPICRGLTQGETAVLFDIAEEASVRKDSKLFTEGDPGDTLLIILEGQVEVTKQGQTLAKVGQGSVLGEMSLLGAAGTRSATATALTDLSLLKVPATRFHKLVHDDNLAALKIVANLAQVMSRRLLMMDEKLIELLDAKVQKKQELADFQRILSDWSF